MTELKEYRNEIDLIDKELVQLLEKRLELSKKIGQYKKERNMEVLNIEREKEVLEKNLSLVEIHDYRPYISEILKAIMEESKKLQSKL
ncbi:MAG: chorismate mutase [Clostridiales bacterium]|uniref:chorismate mutase n=1 Tax=Clostridium sp. N3C TaxID=1776758 RepID=UPI00092E196B|nr:chorismate mutase [Clostridium sp. N3C]NLZ49973.1 chorismate mutase [Clostridiales bacterium]SCN22368.1 T-protein [Clostridium sp. N3C]